MKSKIAINAARQKMKRLAERARKLKNTIQSLEEEHALILSMFEKLRHELLTGFVKHAAEMFLQELRNDGLMRQHITKGYLPGIGFLPPMPAKGIVKAIIIDERRYDIREGRFVEVTENLSHPVS